MADVICPNCNERYHDTTSKYRPDVSPNGSMFKLKDHCVDNGWSSFVEDESSVHENLCCPDCGGTYVEGAAGRVRVDKEQYDKEMFESYVPTLPGIQVGVKKATVKEKVPCPHCGKMFAASGLHFHINAKHGDI